MVLYRNVTEIHVTLRTCMAQLLCQYLSQELNTSGAN